MSVIRFSAIAWYLLLVGASGCDVSSTSTDASVEVEVTPVTELYQFCLSEAKECESYVVDLLLYLDTGNLPSSNNNIKKLKLYDKPTTPAPMSYSFGLELSFTGDLSADIDPGLVGKTGWKVNVTGAAIEYWKADINGDSSDQISLKCSIDDVEFIEDQADKETIFTKKRKIAGR